MEENAYKKISVNAQRVILVYAVNFVSLNDVHFEESFQLLYVKSNNQRKLCIYLSFQPNVSSLV